MKDKLIMLTVILAVVAATLMFAHSIDHYDDNIDKLHRGLTGINKVLNNNTNVTLRCYDVDRSIHSGIRYILAPSYVSLVYAYDTVLTISSLRIADSISVTATSNKKLLWHNKDDRYAYYLTAGK